MSLHKQQQEDQHQTQQQQHQQQQQQQQPQQHQQQPRHSGRRQSQRQQRQRQRQQQQQEGGSPAPTSRLATNSGLRFGSAGGTAGGGDSGNSAQPLPPLVRHGPGALHPQPFGPAAPHVGGAFVARAPSMGQQQERWQHRVSQQIEQRLAEEWRMQEELSSSEGETELELLSTFREKIKAIAARTARMVAVAASSEGVHGHFSAGDSAGSRFSNGMFRRPPAYAYAPLPSGYSPPQSAAHGAVFAPPPLLSGTTVGSPTAPPVGSVSGGGNVGV